MKSLSKVAKKETVMATTREEVSSSSRSRNANVLGTAWTNASIAGYSQQSEETAAAPAVIFDDPDLHKAIKMYLTMETREEEESKKKQAISFEVFYS